jgi:hypothetical protein
MKNKFLIFVVLNIGCMCVKADTFLPLEEEVGKVLTDPSEEIPSEAS